METTEVVSAQELARRESRARRMLAKQGLALRKSRARNWSIDNHLGYMIINPNYNFIVGGQRWDLDLEAVEDWASNDDDA